MHAKGIRMTGSHQRWQLEMRHAEMAVEAPFQLLAVPTSERTCHAHGSVHNLKSTRRERRC